MSTASDLDHVPVVDLAPLRSGSDPTTVAEALGRACRAHGFFYVRGHGVDEELQSRLEASARELFALPLERKMSIRMARGGRAWRGYFPLGAELTSGKPDQKEGIYFGAELQEDHPAVAAGTPLHGRNLFPDELPALREAVLGYLEALTALGQELMSGIALSLGLPSSYFREGLTRDPLVLFRIFHYPSVAPTATTAPPSVHAKDGVLWGVGEHTDYGLLTILRQDQVGGLQVKTPRGWIDAPPIPGTFVCNIGDMLDRMTGGLYRSTPHRVLNTSGRSRLSFPFFFDPGFDAEVRPIDTGAHVVDDRDQRWDRASVHEWSGTYGDYLLAKVSKVFPELRREALPEG
jgi:isopenicillin N synthase-like dioxygenase